MTKAELRAEMRRKRRSLSPEEIARKSAVISRKLLSLPEYKSADAVMLYISAFGEVSTRELAELMPADGKRVAAPVCDTETKAAAPYYMESASRLKRGAYGILEPERTEKARIEDFGLIVVPGLAFDLRGARLGFGEGYYDRLLSGTSVTRAALCYDFQLMDEIPADALDVPMDIIITERRLVRR